MDFAIFRRNFDEILAEFHRNGQEMTTFLEISKEMRESECGRRSKRTTILRKTDLQKEKKEVHSSSKTKKVAQ